MLVSVVFSNADDDGDDDDADDKEDNCCWIEFHTSAFLVKTVLW